MPVRVWFDLWFSIHLVFPASSAFPFLFLFPRWSLQDSPQERKIKLFVPSETIPHGKATRGGKLGRNRLETARHPP